MNVYNHGMQIVMHIDRVNWKESPTLQLQLIFHITDQKQGSFVDKYFHNNKGVDR